MAKGFAAALTFPRATGADDRRPRAPRPPRPAWADGRLRYWLSMNPTRKRAVRLSVALSAAVVLAGALIYTSFSAASPALSPSQLVRQAQPGRSYQLTGSVVAGSVRHAGGTLDFSVQDRAGGTAIPVSYTGTVPDPFREGREIIVTVHEQGGRFVGERDSLITKCPSKYQTAPAAAKQNY
jgi:cytochrome c-type biogenesis protein CcmE